jgi:prepilin-type N-terminal cleavage/methylation domain-containing protein
MTTPRARLQHARGFTLIELMITIVIFGILVAILGPNLSGYLNFNRLDRAANQVTGDIAYARMVAVRSAQRVTLEFTPTGYHVLRNGTADPVKRVSLAQEHPGLSLSLTPAQAGTGDVIGTLVFDSRGILQGGGSSTIRLQRSGKNAELQVSLTGRVIRDN